MHFWFNAATGYPGAVPARVQRRISVFKPNRTIQFLFGRWLGPFSLSCILILAPDNLRPFHFVFYQVCLFIAAGVRTLVIWASFICCAEDLAAPAFNRKSTRLNSSHTT